MLLSNSSLETATYVLTYYGYSFMLIFGTIGNILNIVLFLRKKLRTTSCNEYFLTSAFTNLIALNVSIITLFCVEAKLWTTTIIFCKIRGYIMSVSLQISRYLILMACFDRYALCSTNAYLRKFCHIRIARRYVIPSVFLIWLVVPLHIPVCITVVNNDCVLIGTSALYNSIYSIILIGTIPPVLMFSFSLLIFRNLKLRQRRRQIHPFIIRPTIQINNENRRPQIKDEQIFAMLLVQVLAYVISSTPYTITQLCLVLKMNKNNGPLDEYEMNITFISFITDMLRFVCPFTSFYLFVFVSRLYRRETKLLLLNIYHRFSSLWNRNNNNNHRHYHNTKLTQKTNPMRLNERRQRQQQKQTDIPRNVIPNVTL